MSTLIVEEAQPLTLGLTIERAGQGGITGLSPTVAIRLGSNPAVYLDWGDNAFKTSGWITKYATMTEAERGQYTRVLDLSLVGGAASGTTVIAEYHASSGGIAGDDHDTIHVVTTNTHTSFLKKALVNRMTEAPGNPGTLILYDDDDATPLLSQELTDYNGGATIGVQGSPSRRTRGT